ncbi:MAG: cytochrome c family protein [Bacteroidales bacterium]|nr:cytochrome c family protein [Bacteroidales bacterium]
MLSKNLILALCLVFFAGSSLTAQDFEYIGAAKCKMCHNKTATGQQYKVWMAGPHANAMKSLSSEEALAIAKEKGIADPTTDPGCIKCHSTAGSIDESLNIGVKITEGVSCETCHGPGSAYKTNTVMKDQAKALAKGLIVPDQKLCEACHNEESPTYKPFNYEEAVKIIAHPIPPKE